MLSIRIRRFSPTQTSTVSSAHLPTSQRLKMDTIQRKQQRRGRHGDGFGSAHDSISKRSHRTECSAFHQKYANARSCTRPGYAYRNFNYHRRTTAGLQQDYSMTIADGSCIGQDPRPRYLPPKSWSGTDRMKAIESAVLYAGTLRPPRQRSRCHPGPSTSEGGCQRHSPKSCAFLAYHSSSTY